MSICGGSGSMIWKKNGIILSSSDARGGIGRILANAPFAVNTFTASEVSEGTVCFAPDVPGDIIEIVVHNEEKWILNRGSVLCWDPWVEIDSKFSARGLLPFGSDEGFVLPSAKLKKGKNVKGRIWISSF
jgi:uncharacterized protein (AIM24 family)